MKVRDSDVLAWVWGQRKMSQVLGAFGLLDFTILRPVLAWRAFWNLWTVYFCNFPIFFSGRGKLRITETSDTESVDTGTQLYSLFARKADVSYFYTQSKTTDEEERKKNRHDSTEVFTVQWCHTKVTMSKILYFSNNFAAYSTVTAEDPSLHAHCNSSLCSLSHHS
jgi:hypothetical protein